MVGSTPTRFRQLSQILRSLRDSHRYFQVDAGSQTPSVNLPLANQDARIQTAELFSHPKSQPDLSAPRHKLQSVRSSASELGYYGIECDARLALDELEMRADPTSARADLAELSHEAHQRGLDLVSRKATALEEPDSESSNHSQT